MYHNSRWISIEIPNTSLLVKLCYQFAATPDCHWTFSAQNGGHKRYAVSTFSTLTDISRICIMLMGSTLKLKRLKVRIWKEAVTDHSTYNCSECRKETRSIRRPHGSRWAGNLWCQSQHLWLHSRKYYCGWVLKCVLNEKGNFLPFVRSELD